jgi:hypothetical protein
MAHEREVEVEAKVEQGRGGSYWGRSRLRLNE